MIKLKMVEEFQCPGCVAGSDTKCGSFKLEEFNNQFHCSKHVPGTTMAGVGKILLGLPKGFNRTTREQGTCVRLCDKPDASHWNNLNVAVWAMEMDGYLFVRTYSPRVDVTWIDVIKGGTMANVPAGTINVAEFIDEID